MFEQIASGGTPSTIYGIGRVLQHPSSFLLLLATSRPLSSLILPAGPYWPLMRLKAIHIVLATYPSQSRWLDIGRPDDYEQAIVEFEQHRAEFLPAE